MINVTKTFIPNKEKYKKYVDQILDSGWLTNNGVFAQQLERRLEEYLGVKHIVLVSNGTLALQIAYRALGLSGEAITTPFTFVATTSSLVWEGIEPVFVDIDPNSYCLDSNKIEEKITTKTSAIVPVHVFGNACDVEKIDEIAKSNNLKVIYDAAHAFDVRYKDKSLLNFGDISTLSFHSTKIFHTIEGGALIINDDEVYNKVRLLINFGISGPDVIDGLGINTKMNEFQAAMGLCILDEIESIKFNRKNVYEYYREGLSKNLTFQRINDNIQWNYSYFPVEFKDENQLLEVRKKLNLKEIYPRRYFYPSLETLNYIKKSYKVEKSNSLAKRILCLPFYDSIDKETLDKIIEIVNSVVDNDKCN
ncbi:aminotransferase DegT [Clostridium zeae]|uniref:Aminotransferase DegT n=1 Tax=Clostridium zeae TaxID=2759022 RepID=A0ABQ1EHD1_9CLOT|nr:DegT/DnrJ/EryC1/StrS family aminotransferase [Clostridium zeae]GFZ33963.1 aminotransferase DegT [Clostridium zeae]